MLRSLLSRVDIGGRAGISHRVTGRPFHHYSQQGFQGMRRTLWRPFWRFLAFVTAGCMYLIVFLNFAGCDRKWMVTSLIYLISCFDKVSFLPIGAQSLHPVVGLYLTTLQIKHSVFHNPLRTCLFKGELFWLTVSVSNVHLAAMIQKFTSGGVDCFYNSL